MSKNKVHEIFCDSLKKLTSMIANLDKQLGTVSQPSIDAAIEHKVQSTSQSENLINTEHSHTFSKKEKKESAPKKEPAPKKESAPKKEEKSSKTQPAAQNVDPSVTLFNECDLRVGKVVELKNKEGSDEIYELKIDLGEKELRNIGTGLRKYVPAEEIKGKFVIVFANLKPKKLGNFVSEGMVLCSYTEDDSKFELPRPSENSKPGDSIFIDGSAPKETLLAPLNDKKFKKAIALFKTDSNCVATFDGKILQTVSGNIKVKSLANCTIS
jgi:aminoacyl tRNA synthase complex-interacting multifunctional protein 1